MITKFELADKVLKEINQPVFPPEGTLMWINKTLYQVSHSCIFFDNDYISVEIFEIE